MKGMLKGYLIYLAGALLVVGYAWWQYQQASGETFTGLIVRARANRNGHVPAEQVSLEEV